MDKKKNSNIAIFWDIENVNPKRGDFFIDGLIEFAESLGKVVIQNAYADWAKEPFRSLGNDLAHQHFYMVHLPYRRNQRSKNGADIQLVTDALDSLRVYDHIDTYVLLTGDSDFRPLLRPLRRMGKTIHIICNLQQASQDLLMIADSFQDYQEILPSKDDDGDEDEAKIVKSKADRDTLKNTPSTSLTKLSPQNREYWFSQLCEAVQALEKESKTINLSTIRIRMRVLNPGFDERKLHFRRWSQFIAAAAKENYILIEEESNSLADSEDQSYNQTVIRVVERKILSNDETQPSLTLQKAMQKLLLILQQGASHKDADSNGFFLYGVLNTRLRADGIDVSSLGFNQFKKFMASAEARGIVETRLMNMNYSARIAKSQELIPSISENTAEK